MHRTLTFAGRQTHVCMHAYVCLPANVNVLCIVNLPVCLTIYSYLSVFMSLSVRPSVCLSLSVSLYFSASNSNSESLHPRFREGPTQYRSVVLRPLSPQLPGSTHPSASLLVPPWFIPVTERTQLKHS